MEATERFKEVIKQYLDNRAAADTLFAAVYNKPHKNLDECIVYILNAVQKSGCNGFEDSEIHSLAVHYFDQDDINVGNPVTCGIVINHHVELTDEEKAQARKDAIKRVHDEAYARLSQTKSKAVQKQPETPQTTLFG